MSSIFLQAKVIRTRSTESMPFPFSFMMVVVSFLWLCYGTVVNDRNIQVTRHSLTPNTQGSQLGRNIYGWNTQMYVVTSLQGERKIHLVPDIVLCWPLLHFALSDAILNFERSRKLSVCQLRGWAPPNFSPNLHKWACSQAVCMLTIMENGCAQGTGLHFSTWRWHPHEGKASTLPVPKL